MGSDNPDGADNQQERLIKVGWVIGFVKPRTELIRILRGHTPNIQDTG
jgi:hypothetical protein